MAISTRMILGFAVILVLWASAFGQRCRPLTSGSLSTNCGEGFCNLRLCIRDPVSNVVPRRQGRNMLFRPKMEGWIPHVCRQTRGGAYKFLQNPMAGEAQVRLAFSTPSPSPYVKISSYRVSDWSGSYPSNYFGFYPGTFGLDIPGIGRVNDDRDQYLRAHALCVRLPIVSFTVRGKKKRRNKDPRHCVEFSAVTSRLEIQLIWDTADDLDLRVTEPDGVVVDKTNRSGTGSTFREVHAGDCTAARWASRETYRHQLHHAHLSQDGTYKVEIVRNFGTICSGNINWKIHVLLDGQVLGTPETGVISQPPNTNFIPLATFMYHITFPPLGFEYKDPRKEACSSS